MLERMLAAPWRCPRRWRWPRRCSPISASDNDWNRKSPGSARSCCRPALIAAALAALYFIGFEASRWQATPGKRLLGLRVQASDGGRLGAGAHGLARFSPARLSLAEFESGPRAGRLARRRPRAARPAGRHAGLGARAAAALGAGAAVAAGRRAGRAAAGSGSRAWPGCWASWRRSSAASDFDLVLAAGRRQHRRVVVGQGLRARRCRRTRRRSRSTASPTSTATGMIAR